MGQESANIPPSLRRLIGQLDELEYVPSPGIVPLVEDSHDSTISAVLEPA
jgi:hypothetical protein